MADLSLEDIIENFNLLDHWEDKYSYLIDLGKTLPPMDPSLKTEDNFVSGCTSKVWIDIQKTDDGRLHLIADSDAHIVRGLIAILLCAYQGQNISDLNNIDIAHAFMQLGLGQHLSPNRRNGFFSMAQRIQEIAE